jgi:methionine aminopeptidase
LIFLALDVNAHVCECCRSINETICHGIPDMRPFEKGDIVNLDVSVFYKGFHVDLNETYMVGEVDAESRRLVEVTYNCLAAAVAMGECVRVVCAIVLARVCVWCSGMADCGYCCHVRGVNGCRV